MEYWVPNTLVLCSSTPFATIIAPESQFRPLHQRLELRPLDRWMDLGAEGALRKAAVAAGFIVICPLPLHSSGPFLWLETLKRLGV